VGAFCNQFTAVTGRNRAISGPWYGSDYGREGRANAPGWAGSASIGWQFVQGMARAVGWGKVGTGAAVARERQARK
jgi:hypothetical protein